ncbi:Ldh family oxidoreductase [Candidatus Roizmanbacteria bacterium]|nr:Ldh family oxidoreductase [Candidatus Roizmanbacteria bacterium]
MKKAITIAREASVKYLIHLGLEQEEAELVMENIIEAELAGRKTHGLTRLISFTRQLKEKEVNNDPLKLDIIHESPTLLHIDGHRKLGYGIIYKSLDLAIAKAKQSGLVSVGIKDLGATGYIGAYARKAAHEDFIYIGFHNSAGGLIPHGAKKDLWGTNPLTVGIPTDREPVILDMASASITIGDILLAQREKKEIPSGVALDREGKPTTNPIQAYAGGILPIAGYKGSGLGLIIELLAGALTGSRVGYSVPGGWGSFYILIDPSQFRPVPEFKRDVQTALEELKNAPKLEGVSEIYYPGEQSNAQRKTHIQEGVIEVSDALIELLHL